ncbi:MAG: UMP kinase [Mycoplasmatales bacterium]
MKKRIILKLSGEALSAGSEKVINQQVIEEISSEIKEVVSNEIEVGIVVGGGNIWRGVEAQELGMDRSQADYMGMMATIMNSLALQDGLEKAGVDTRVQTTLRVDSVAEPYIRRKAIRHLEKGRVVIFAGGTGMPYFSTDTNTMLKAAEVDAQYVLMAKNGVDGVYDKDPNKFGDAIKYDKLTFREMLEKQLKVIDLTAATMAEENNLEVIIFDMNEKGNIVKVLNETKIGTKIKKGE